VQLTGARSRELLAKHRVYVTEVCNRCSRALGHIRFTRFGEGGEWCSRLCRDGAEALAVRKGGRPRKHKNGALRQRAYRVRLHVRKRYETPSKGIDS
jgi:hypothetical protein